MSIDTTADEFANKRTGRFLRPEISIPFLPMNSEYRGERINHVRFGMEVCGWNFACRNRWRRRLFFYAKNKSTPTRTIGIANKVRFFPLGWDTSSAFIVPSIICLFHLREEPTQFSFQMDTHTHTHTHARAGKWEWRWR